MLLTYLVIVFTALTLCLELFAGKVVNYDTMLARWMVHISWRGTLYMDSKERDPARVIGSVML